MISFLRGQILERSPARVVLEVHGVGYELHIPVSTYSQLPVPGETAALRVHTHVREDTLQLFGFATPLEKTVFEKLLAVSGVGPKLALAVLSGLPAEELAGAIARSDIARLVTIPGVGRKTAERICVELREKIGDWAATAAARAPAASEEVLSALVNLGYPRAAAEKILARVLSKEGALAGDFDALFKRCMQALG